MIRLLDNWLIVEESWCHNFKVWSTDHPNVFHLWAVVDLLSCLGHWGFNLVFFKRNGYDQAALPGLRLKLRSYGVTFHLVAQTQCHRLDTRSNLLKIKKHMNILLYGLMHLCKFDHWLLLYECCSFFTLWLSWSSFNSYYKLPLRILYFLLFLSHFWFLFTWWNGFLSWWTNLFLCLSGNVSKDLV